jgi:hypothetical protein
MVLTGLDFLDAAIVALAVVAGVLCVFFSAGIFTMFVEPSTEGPIRRRRVENLLAFAFGVVVVSVLAAFFWLMLIPAAVVTALSVDQGSRRGTGRAAVLRRLGMVRAARTSDAPRYPSARCAVRPVRACQRPITTWQ